MKEFEWTFGLPNYIEIKRVNSVSKCACFAYDERLRISIHWTAESLTEREWDCILACVRQAKMVLKKLKRI